MHKTTAAIAIAISLLANVAFAAPMNPYAGQQTREIKALSEEDFQGYLSGKGMGLAKAAELNGYPGPSHVLSLSSELALTPKQEQQTKELFKQMEERSSVIGKQIVEEERTLNELFASKTVTPQLLASTVARIGQLQGQFRDAHLEAHITEAAILTPEQLTKYQELRGYGNATEPMPHHHEHQ
jgi:Spy/CpxP family protein refolding chaperone